MNPSPHPSASATTRRLLACVESFAHQEEGAIGHDDWPALASLLDRELAVLTRLAAEAGPESLVDLRARAAAEALRERYTELERRLTEARRRATEEFAELGGTARRLRAVQGAYGQAA